MTPQERQLVDDLFDRLAKVDGAPRDPDAVSAIGQGLQRAPNALYALVQTVLLQDEALRRAHDRIQELEAASAPAQSQPGGFLDSMRETIFGQSQPRGSVPNVRPPEAPSRPVWNSGQVMPQAGTQYDQGPYGQGAYGQGYRTPTFGGGGSFLGTAAAAAAGVVGGSLLLNGIRSMMGGHQQSFADTGAMGDRAASPWSDQSDSALARDAGIDEIGQGGGHGGRADGSSGVGLFDQAADDQASDDEQDSRDAMDLDADDFGNDGGSDYA